MLSLTSIDSNVILNLPFTEEKKFTEKKNAVPTYSEVTLHTLITF
jgi:hypothetical protein